MASAASFTPSPEPILVGDGPECTFRTIGQAVSWARPGMQIRVLPGHYNEAVWITQAVELVKHTADGVVVVECGVQATITVDTVSAVTIRGLTIRDRGVEIRSEGALVALEECVVSKGQVSQKLDLGYPRLRNRAIVLRSCSFQDASLRMSGAQVEACTFSSHQGAAVSGDGLRIHRCTFMQNDIAIHAYDGHGGPRRAEVRDCVFANNGIGVDFSDPSSSPNTHNWTFLDISGCTFRGNKRAGIRGGSYASALVQRCDFTQQPKLPVIGPRVELHDNLGYRKPSFWERVFG